jgi:P27 family predicted phage terminase small subunit
MGRKKEDIADKKLRGTVRKDRVQVETVDPGKPMTDWAAARSVSGYSDLSMRAKALYRQKCKELIAGPGLYVTDLHQIIMYAHAYDRFWTYEDAVQEHGAVVKVKSKFGETLIANPAVKMQRDALKDVTAIAARFGFSPVDRAKLKLEVKEEDPLAEFMKEFGGKEE